MKRYDFFYDEDQEQFWNSSHPICDKNHPSSLSDMMIILVNNEIQQCMLSLVDHYLLCLGDEDNIKWLNLENVSVEMIKSTVAGDGIQLMKGYHSFQFFGDVEPWYNCFKQFCVLRNFTHYYTFTQKIGKGNFAEVFKAQHKLIQQEFAIKCFQKNQLKNDDRKAIIKEISILRKIQNDSILRLYEVFESEERIFLVMELLNGGELYRYLKKSPPFSEEKCAKLIHKLLKSLQYIHSKGIIHRDLKPENLILRKKDDYLDICIADFGLADYYNPQGKYLFTRCGTPGYVAPELLQDKIYDYKVDVYSIGILMYILITGQSPFDSTEYQEIVMKNYHGQVNFDKVKLSEQGLSILKGLLNKNPLKRLSVSEALTHNWFIQEKLTKSCQFKIRKNQLLKKLGDHHFHQSTQISPITILSPRYSKLNLEESNSPITPFTHRKMRQIRKSIININIK